MPARNDYKCNGCNQVLEFMGPPEAPCGNCGANDWEWVPPREMPQYRTQHASAVDHAIEQKNVNEEERIDEIVEDDAFKSMMQEAAEVAETGEDESR